MQPQIRFIRSLGCAAVLAGAVVTSTHASFIEIVGDGDKSTDKLGQVYGSIHYAAAAQTLTISLTNASDPADGGFITGFLFNIDSQDAAARATLTSSSHAFTNIRGMAPPFGGPYPAGAGLAGGWAGSGSPLQGISAGHTGVFVFNVSASDAALLSAMSFISGNLPFNFVVRFRGFSNGLSDKVPMVVGTPNDPIPGPSALGLLAIGALWGARRRRTTQ